MSAASSPSCKKCSLGVTNASGTDYRISLGPQSEPGSSQIQAISQESIAMVAHQSVSWADPSKLLRFRDLRNVAAFIPDWTFQWYQNLGLLMNVYTKTEDLAIKKLVGFLVFNYLGKSAPISRCSMPEDEATQRQLSRCFQLSPIDPGIIYNRETNAFDDYFRPIITEEFPLASGKRFFLVDTTDIAEVLATASTYTCIQKCDQTTVQCWTDLFREFLRQHQAQNPQQTAAHWATAPLLVDVTALFESTIHTGGDPAKEEEFAQSFHHAEALLNQAIDQAILSSEWEGVSREEIRAWLVANLTCICRSDVRSVSVLNILPLLCNLHSFLISQGVPRILGNTETLPGHAARGLLVAKESRSQAVVKHILDTSGIRLGSVNGRWKVSHCLSLEQFIEQIPGSALVEYDGNGERWFYCQNKIDPVSTHLFRKMERIFDPGTEEGVIARSKPYLSVLGGCTLKLFKGLMTEMSEKQWTILNSHPDLQKILQTTLFKIHIHLAHSEACLEDFSRFSQLMELIHYEMATLLTLIEPFRAGDFSAIFKEHLQEIVPSEIRDFVQVGISKSAMNTFAGINTALKRMHPHPVRVIHPSVHFEILQCLGHDEELSQVMKDRGIPQVDLFLGCMNPNIQLISSCDHYAAENIIQEVTALLEAKPDTRHLTVGLDSTIEFIKSPKVYEILRRFSSEIQTGRLNFIFFRSGQKFDMFGMDDYYGSPWFMVNNRADYWAPFQVLSTHEAFQVDPLSMQWFCLSHRYAFADLEMYRRMIFENSKEILRYVPQSLLPGKNSQIKVCLVDEGTEPCFLDVKCYGDQGAALAYRIRDRMCQLFTERGVKMHFRAGYGYMHPNIVLFKAGLDRAECKIPYTTLRIHPGINREENRLFIELLGEISELAASVPTLQEFPVKI